VETTIDTYGKVDILVNNAGITRDQLIMRMSDDDWDAVLGVNLKSVFLCTRAVLRPMMKQRWGRIVSMASIVGLTANAVAPGFIDTLMTQQLPDERKKALADQIILGYLGTPRDVAEAVAFLASEEARYITGQVLTVDGGISLGKM